MSALRLGLVGCGDIAMRGHLPAIARSDQVELVGVLDADPAAASAATCAFGGAVLNSIEDFAAKEVRALIVATPPHITPHLTIDALGAGLDVLCEKPMAVEVEVAEDVRDLAERSGRILQVGFKNRFSPLVRAVRNWLRLGELGAPVVFTLGSFDEALDPGDPMHERRIRAFLDAAPSFVHEGAHFADYLAFLTGSVPVDVQALGVRSMTDLGSENFGSALVRYANGDVARLEIGWLFPVSPLGEFRALGPEGVVLLDRPGGVARLLRRDRTEEVRLDRPWNDVCFDRQLAHFVECVRSRTTPETSAAVGVASLRLGWQVVEAMHRAGGAT